MMKILLSTAFVSLCMACISDVAAQSFDASKWGKNQQSFNSTKNFTYGADSKSLTVELGARDANGLLRAEIANLAPVTLGGENTVVIFKVTYKNSTFINFDKNMIYVRRQMRDDSATTSEETAVAPYFITSQNANAGRYASGNDATEAYYWRYMPGLANENVKPTVAPDWSVPFEVPSSFANNRMFEFDGQEVYGYSYLGIRVVHSADNADSAPGVLGDDAEVTFDYIGVTSPVGLGYASADEFTSASNVTAGKSVRDYIEKILHPVSTGIESVGDDCRIGVSVDGSTVWASGATRMEIYDMTGVRVAASSGRVDLSPGLYIVTAYDGGSAITKKISIR